MNERHALRPFTSKSRLQRLRKTANHSLNLPSVRSGTNLIDGLPTKQAAKAGLIAGGLAGVTAASAGISSLRRARGGRDHS